MSRRVAVGLAVVLIAAGAAAVVAGIVAAGRREPAKVSWDGHTFAVKRRDLVSAEAIDFVRPDGSVATSIAGSTDLVCDPPRLFLVNVDDDSELEVVFTTCDEPGFVDHRGRGELAVMELSERRAAELAPLHSFWFRQVRDGGWMLVGSGMVGVLIGAAAMLLVVLRRRRSGPVLGQAQ